MQHPPPLTDRPALLRHRARAGTMFLQKAVADEFDERLAEVNRSFTNPAIVTGFPDFWRMRWPEATIVADDEVLSLSAATHDLVFHALGLHWANDPVGQLVQCRHALKPDGLLIAALFGGQTLHQLRSALAAAESRLTGGLSPRVAPMGEVRDLGGLLQRAGLALPVADVMPLLVTYADLWPLMRDLRAMGEGNALASRLRHPTRKAIFDMAASIYRDSFGLPDGRIPATFEVIMLTGWAPGPDQQKPQRRGSATHHLADVLAAKDTPILPGGD